MAAKKKKPKKAAKKSATKPKPFSTPFVRAIVKTHILDGATTKWPPPGAGVADMAKDISEVGEVLFTAAFLMVTPSSPANKVTLAESIQDDLVKQDWPAADAKRLQKNHGLAKQTLRIAEAGAIVSSMLRSVSSLNPSGVGGGPGESTKIPPH